MDRDSKILILITTLLLVTSISFTYYRFFIAKDYIVENSEETDLSE